ncbi:MAG: hypothetical protein ACJA0V_002937 [Planctomycetota bacterium]|jgi:hypothetical protein
MTVRGCATRSWWLLACLLAGCVQHRDQQPGGTFGHSRSGLFADPVASEAVRDDAAAVDAAAVDSAAGDPTLGDPVPATTTNEGVATGSYGSTASDAELPARNAGAPKIDPNRSNSALAVTPAASSVSSAPAKPIEASTTSHGRNERQLRNAFANADKEAVTQAALDLAGYLVQQERQFDALFVVDAGLKRQHSVPLRLARAGLLRDVARCDLAAIELQAVVRQLGAKNVSPATLFDLVQAEWVAGQGDAAAATLRSIQQAHAGDAWLRDHATDMAEWDRRIREVAPGRDPLANGELRDLFALLRAAPEAAGRLKILNTLAVPPKTRNPQSNQQDDDERRPVRIRAIAIACADESTAVRARAVYLAAANHLTDDRFWQIALTDAAPLVRGFAATGASQQHGREAAPLLFEAICREQDEQTFGTLHAALAMALQVAAPTCIANTEVGRKQAIAHWRTQCEQ